MTDPEVFREFFLQLSEDDAFRESVVANPALVMQEYGIEYDEDSIPEVVQLPDKAVIKANLDRYVDEMGREPVTFRIWVFLLDPPQSQS